jgi:hypothetical protein
MLWQGHCLYLSGKSFGRHNQEGGEVSKEGFSLEQQKKEGPSKESIGNHLIDEPSLFRLFSGSSLQHGASWVVSSWL